jgi:hypothetical protein
MRSNSCRKKATGFCSSAPSRGPFHYPQGSYEGLGCGAARAKSLLRTRCVSGRRDRFERNFIAVAHCPTLRPRTSSGRNCPCHIAATSTFHSPWFCLLIPGRRCGQRLAWQQRACLVRSRSCIADLGLLLPTSTSYTWHRPGGCFMSAIDRKATMARNLPAHR